MVKNMKRNLKNMMSKILFFLLLIISSNVYSTSSMSGVYVDNGNISIHCDESDSLDYSCSINIYKKYNNTIRIKNNNDCSYFSISPKGDDEVVVECGLSDILNTYLYKLNNGDLILSEYKYLSSDDRFDTASPLLLNENRSISNDITSDGNKMVSIAYINKKSYFYDYDFNKTKSYLIKGDKVLIMKPIKINNSIKWYEVLFVGKQITRNLIKYSDISYIGNGSSYLIN